MTNFDVVKLREGYSKDLYIYIYVLIDIIRERADGATLTYDEVKSLWS